MDTPQQESAEFVDGCPLATQDIMVNLKNRQKAIDTAKYGPMIPANPNNGFWSAKSKLFKVPVAEAKQARCSNCAAFIQTDDILSCIRKGLDDNPIEHANDTMYIANLGFCNIFDFKCAGDRTCDAWVAGGPINNMNSPQMMQEMMQGQEMPMPPEQTGMP
jgi:hypothetical protein